MDFLSKIILEVALIILLPIFIMGLVSWYLLGWVGSLIFSLIIIVIIAWIIHKEPKYPIIEQKVTTTKQNYIEKENKPVYHIPRIKCHK